MDCVYLQDHQQCLLRQQKPCITCGEKLTSDDPALANKWRDPLTVIDRARHPATDVLRDLLAGSSAFLVCGGPSANALPLELLNGKGIWSMAVNNAAAHPRYRPQAFVCSDPPTKFSHCIWMDPGIAKFIPIPKLGRGRRNIRRKLPDGTFEILQQRTTEAPNTWGFQRWNWMWPDDRFFIGDGACWGNHRDGVAKTGQPKTVCTMLLGIRLLRFLGARRIFLVGVDFRMRPDYGYSFAQERDQAACASNNAQFAVVNDWLCEMERVGTFKRFGLEILNCFEMSGLRAFPYVDFRDAIKIAKGIVDDVPDLSKWYLK
jgi:hypothetical protein